jgi:hypothetical protein
MGKIGKCCCGECLPCTEQAGLATWAITETILGFDFSGAFGSLNEFSCNKCGTQCQRLDNEDLGGENSVVSDWGGWFLLHGCGVCLDCSDPLDPIDLPPCPVDIISGGVVCPPDYPTYSQVWAQTRNGFRVKFWLSKMARATVCVNYINTNQVQFSVQVYWKVNIAETSSYGTQRRWKRETRLCTYDTLISTFNSTSGSVPS